MIPFNMENCRSSYGKSDIYLNFLLLLFLNTVITKETAVKIGTPL